MPEEDIMAQGWLRRRVLDPFIGLIRQGVTPEKLAQCVAFGLVIGLFPILGCTTAIAAAAAIAFRLNMIAIQTVNYLVSPLWLILLIPFYHAGGWLFGDPPFTLSANEIISLFRESPLSALQRLGLGTIHAVIAWAIVALIAIPLLSLLFIPLFRKARAVIQTQD